VSDVAAAVDALLHELTRRGSPLTTHLNPGLPVDEIVRVMREIGAQPDADVVQLYSWRNGFDRFQVPHSDNGIASLVPSHQEFNQLNEAADLFTQRRKLAEGEAVYMNPDDIWAREWFPVFEAPGSEVIFVNNGPNDPGSVWLHPLSDEPQRLFDSLAHAFDAVRTALSVGFLELDARGVFTFESARRWGKRL
jgi:hypothetical protein